MRGVSTAPETINRIQFLRSHGKSISEISSEVKRSKSIISKYIQGVKILPKYYDSLKIKQGGSVYRSNTEWAEKRDESVGWIKNVTQKEKILILASLYWGEGTKRELNIINGDPTMLRVFLVCLKEIGVKDSELRITLRLYCDINKNEALNFWIKTLNVPKSCFGGINIIKGKKEGKLEYGMCRIRVEKGAKYFKLIMCFIERIKLLLS